MESRLLAGLLLLMCAPCFSQESAERKAVLATVQRLFDAMAARDPAAAKAVILPEGRYFSIRKEARPGGASLLEFAEGLAARKERLLERMFHPEVRIEGPLAMVWTPYDFHRDGKFSHCGTDSFLLLKIGGEWKIASLAYTVETAGCTQR